MKLSHRSILIITFALTMLFAAHGDAAGKDVWTQVRSKNFFLVGNASEKEIRKVGTRLEQFRETFRLIFNNTRVTAAIPTNVIVFKNDAAYKNFKPKRADGKIDTQIAGYFQPGEDVNYITISAEGPDKDMFGTIFHEYVHFIIETNFGKADVPPWFNEGLAEYYQTFEIIDDQKVRLGLPQGGHLNLLLQTRLMPLDTLFNISNYQLHQTADHSRSIFYAQSWALIHYLIQSGKSEALDKFLKAVTGGTPPEKAFQDTFQTTYANMETELKRYVAQSRFNYHEYTFKLKLVYDAEMQASPISDAASNAYLGDLLYHTNRADDAEPFLLEAINAEPSSSLANTALGMVKMRQRKYDEAKSLLEKAIAGDNSNHIALYRYAFLLSREGQDEFGYSMSMEKATAEKIRELLRKAIAINPAFTESYELLAYVDLVRNEEIDDAIAQLQKARAYQPGNQRYTLRIAELYVRQNKYDEATAIAQKIARWSDDDELRTRAANLLARVKQMKEIDERNAAERKRYEAAVAAARDGRPLVVRRVEKNEKLTEAEIVKQQQEAELRSMNLALREPDAATERRVIGRVQKIDCKSRPLVFTIKTPAETFTVTTADFNSLVLNTFDAAANDVQVGCDASLAAFNAVITYKAASPAKGTSRGSLVALEFVPAAFRLMTVDELKSQMLVIYPGDDAPPTAAATSGTSGRPPQNDAEIEAKRREMVLKSITDALRKPADGERREIGFLDKIECTKTNFIFNLRTAAKTFRLAVNPSVPPKIGGFVSDLAGIRFDCNLRPVEYPAVFIFAERADAKAKTDGDLRSMEFVPKSFVLEQ